VAHSLTNDLLRDFFSLWNIIQSVHLDLISDMQEDQITWVLESSGQYSAKSAYDIQFDGNVHSTFPTLICKAWAPPRYKIFMWLLLRDRVWTAARLQLRGWDNNFFCVLCERILETSTHLFIECPFPVWFGAKWQLGVMSKPAAITMVGVLV